MAETKRTNFENLKESLERLQRAQIKHKDNIMEWESTIKKMAD
jgi:hypothetical protein